MEIGGYQDFKNDENRARWLWRWSMCRVTDHTLRHTPKSKKKVINLAAVRIERAKRKRA
jgi:hypothetical protein